MPENFCWLIFTAENDLRKGGLYTDFIDKYTNDSEQRILLKRINDLIARSEKQYKVMYSPFLDPAQQALVLSVREFYGYVSMVGGYDDAERRMCRVSASEYCSDDDPPIVLFCAKASMKEADISHRDVLGALMGLGIKREMIGDILPNKNEPQFFCHSSIAGHIELNLTKIGRYSVVVSRADTAEIVLPKYEMFNVNVSSMRLDSICAEAFGMSRTKAAEAVRQGLVCVNWLEVTDTSAEVRSGDKISLRGKGKIEVGDVSGISKKGRLFVDIKKKI